MNLRTSILSLLGGLCLAVSLACGGGSKGDGNPPPTVSISVAPTTANLLTGGTQTFTASVTGSSNTAAAWTVQEGASGGTVTAGGLYTAPATAGTYHVVATSAADNTKSATAAITVTAAPVVAVSLTPTAPTLIPGATQTFTATVTGSANTAVTWTVQEGAAGGAITSGGVYTAPAWTGTYHVVATSAADTSKTASATVTVMALPVVAISVTPIAPSLITGTTQTFTAAVTGSANTAVTWSVQEGASGGTITSGGLYTAPATSGTYHVVATSVADATKSATATITVTAAPVVAVSLTPTAPSLYTGNTQIFTAKVIGSANTAVTWAVQEGAIGGAITSGGLYTAPASVGTYHVVATSAADVTKSATATVTVAAAPVVAVSLTPTAPSLFTGGTQTFVATVTGTGITAVAWTVQEGATGGTITSGGVYTAPASAGTYHVVATSAADATKSATATVTVTLPPTATALAYVDPSTGTYRLVKNTTLSTPTHLVLDLTGVSGPSGAGIAFTFTVDTARAAWAKVASADLEYVQNGTVLTPGSAPLPLKGKVATTTLSGAVGQKGLGASVTLNGVLGRVALDLQAGAPLGVAALTSPKAQILQADGTITTVSITPGTLAAN